jgi:hypothetical protein
VSFIDDAHAAAAQFRDNFVSIGEFLSDHSYPTVRSTPDKTPTDKRPDD